MEKPVSKSEGSLDRGRSPSELLAKPVPRPRSSLSPTPFSVREHTPSSVRFSETAESYSYSNTFEDAVTVTKAESGLDQTLDQSSWKLSYTETFVSGREESPVSARAGSASRRSVEPDTSLTCNNTIYSDTFELTSASKAQLSKDTDRSGHSHYSSDFEVDTQGGGNSLIDSQRRLVTEDTVSSLPGRSDYTDTFDTSDLSPSEEESDSTPIEQSEADARDEFLRRAIDQLRSLRQSQQNELSVSSNPNDSSASVKTQRAPEATIQYCRDKVKLLKKKKKYGLACRLAPARSAEEERVPVTEYGFHPSIVEKLKTKSFMAAMEKAARTEIHDPRECTDCCIEQQRIDGKEQEKLFVRGKIAHLQRKAMEDKICNHLAKMDSISLIGDIMRDLPKVSDRPEDITKRLQQPLTDYRNSLLQTKNRLPIDQHLSENGANSTTAS